LSSALLCAAALAAFAATAAPVVQLEQMTSTELRARIAAGATTVLLPIGGTEQNGSHMSLGKHNVRVGLLAVRIAERLGNAVVAPVLAYVPEGNIDPPSQHMRYAGTLSIPEPVFEATLEAAARSLHRHGLRDVVLLGDHGASLDRVAAKLNREWGARGHVDAAPAYYRAADTEFTAWLVARGFSRDEIGLHAGLADTALMLALDPAQVRAEVAAQGAGEGVRGDPRRATAALGQAGVEMIVAATVKALRPAAAPAR